MTKKDKDLIETHKIRYRLRSTFFYNKLNEYHTYEFPQIITELIPVSNNYDWTGYDKWGVSEEAFQAIKESKLSPIKVFSHPRLLREHPILTGYYRNVSVLSQKAVSYLVNIHPLRFENDNEIDMGEVNALVLSRLFNEHVSLIIENVLGNISEEDINGLLFASTGAQIDGSWRNAIGEESERIVRKMLIKKAIEMSVLTAFNKKSGEVEQLGEAISDHIERIKEYKGFTLNNKKSVLFSSEPDISLIDTDGSTIAAIEIKGGADPAGALERYGAAKKSFENSLNDNEDVETVLVASCLTPEVESRLGKDNEIKTYFNLTSLLVHKEEKERFLNYIFKKLLDL